MSTYEVAKAFNCCQATIWKRIHEFGIKPRSPWEMRSNIPPKSLLQEMYVKRRMSTWEIERRFGYYRSTVRTYLKKHGWIRSPSESHILYPRKSFSGDPLEKAYLMGFAIGDLRVRKNGKSINIECGTTKQEQIDLIQEMFQDYGKVWITKPNKRGARNIGVGLDMSFEFLLSKNIEGWITNDKDCFFAFLGGFTDAEGHIGVHSNQAKYSLGNYDGKLLEKIFLNLNKYGVRCNKVINNKTKGYVSREGYVHNDDYKSITIVRKAELLKLFVLLFPYIKHRKKITDLNNATRNLIKRVKNRGF